MYGPSDLAVACACSYAAGAVCWWALCRGAEALGEWLRRHGADLDAPVVVLRAAARRGAADRAGADVPALRVVRAPEPGLDHGAGLADDGGDRRQAFLADLARVGCHVEELNIVED